MTWKCWTPLALVLGIFTAFACNPPPTHPPPESDERDAARTAEADSSAQASSPSCATLGGRCIEPGGPCPVQIAGKDPCGSVEGGSSGQICCAGD